MNYSQRIKTRKIKSDIYKRVDSEKRKVTLPGEFFMKIIVLIPLIVIIGCILTTGCVGQIKNTTENVTVVTTINTFAPLSNVTNLTNLTNTTVTSGLKGPLRVSIGGWETDLPVFVDNKSVGIASHDKPLDLMIYEGNHTVRVCAGTMCKEEIVTVQFAKQRLVDFEEWLIREVEFAKPTARIVGYYPSGDQYTISVEFINPTTKDLIIQAEIKAGYTYIEPRSNNRVGSVAQGIVSANVRSGSRAMETLYLDLASGYSYSHAIPVVSSVTTR